MDHHTPEPVSSSEIGQQPRSLGKRLWAKLIRLLTEPICQSPEKEAPATESASAAEAACPGEIALQTTSTDAVPSTPPSPDEAATNADNAPYVPETPWLETWWREACERKAAEEKTSDNEGLSETQRIKQIPRRFKKLDIPGTPFTFKTYKLFVRECDLLIVAYQGASTYMGSPPPEYFQREGRLYFALPPIYWAKLPTYVLARCPICGGKVSEAVDTFSLGGMGWWYNAPRGFGWFGRPPGGTRPFRRYPGLSYHADCQHMRALVYGVNFNGIYPDDARPRFALETGSERPGVLRPFMEQTGTYAVIHTLPVGRLTDAKWQPRYTAYFISYFSEDAEAYARSLAPQEPEDLSFCWPYDQLDDDLAPWVEAGKLQWLGAEDDGYPLLQGSTDEFPYADMDGLRGRWSIFGKNLKLLPQDMTLLKLRHPSPRRQKAFARLRPIAKQMLRDRDLRIL